MLAKSTGFLKLAQSTNQSAALFLGSIEQHGPFLPLGTDTLMAEALIDQLEEKLGDKLVLFPVLPFGCAKEHRGFAGTIAIEYSTYMLFIKDILKSFNMAGFKKVLMISTHGGNDLVARLIQADWNYENKMKVEYLFAFDESVDKKTKELFGGSEMHAGSSESSTIAFLYPNVVGFIGSKTDRRFATQRDGVFTTLSTKEVTKLGILNFSPKLEIDPQKGKELFEFIVSNLCQRIEGIISG